MFSGIIEHSGVVIGLSRSKKGCRLEIAARHFFAATKISQSIAVDGVCLTLIGKTADRAAFDIGPETLKITTLGELKPGAEVNLEKPLRLQDYVGGHLIQGHVDGTAEVVKRTKAGTSVMMHFRTDPSLHRYLISKGSVALNGVSLTVARLWSRQFSVMLLKYTLDKTNFRELEVGSRVNIEIDMMAKYLRQLSRR